MRATAAPMTSTVRTGISSSTRFGRCCSITLILRSESDG
jgi:hypothetical protein